MSTIQGQSTSNASSITQKAATAALNGDQACVVEMNRHFKARHDFFIAGPQRAARFRSACRGDVLRLLRRSKAINALGLADDNAFAEFLIEKAGVAVVPGSGFGAPGHIRLSFACSMETLEKALERIGKA